MRIYEVRHLGRAIEFARSFDQARRVLRKIDPKARKIANHLFIDEYSGNLEIHAIEIKPDKEGIITTLNSLIERCFGLHPKQKSNLPEEPSLKNFEGNIKDNLEVCQKIIDSKEVGYVGGVPRVNPPAAIRDEDSRERQKDIEKHRMYSDPDENWSGNR